MGVTNHRLRILDLFAGIGGFSLAGHRVGWETVQFVEWDKYNQKVLGKNFPGVPIHADITDYHGEKYSADIITGGFPCFPAGTMVRTSKGLREIERLGLGDLVLTKEDRYKPVNALMQKHDAPTTSIKFQGDYEPLLATHEHPIWCRKKYLPHARKYEDRYAEPTWVNASEVEKGDLISFVCCNGSNQYGTTALWYLIGRYLGDGWILDGKRKSNVPQGKRGSRVTSKNHKVVICCDRIETEYVLSKIKEAGFHATISVERTADKLIISSKKLVKILRPFGRYAHGKRVAGLAHNQSDEHKAALVEGWTDADGHDDSSGLDGGRTPQAATGSEAPNEFSTGRDEDGQRLRTQHGQRDSYAPDPDPHGREEGA